MRFSQSVLLLPAALSVVAASPLVAMQSESDALANGYYVELRRETSTIDNGTLVFYGLAPGVEANQRYTQAEQAFCPYGGDAPVKCDRYNGARNDVCTKLLSDLSNNPQSPFDIDIRQMCRWADVGSDKCCVSWHEKVGGLHYSDVEDAVRHMKNICSADGVSAKIDSMKLNNVCSAVCLSNRGTQC